MNITRHSFQFLMELEFSRQIFENFSYIKFREKSVQREPSCSQKRTFVTKKIAGFPNAVKVPKYHTNFSRSLTLFYNILVRVPSPDKTSCIKFVS